MTAPVAASGGSFSPDDDARRQIREVLDETFLVEAGAGTGKTSALVERMITLVLGGRRIERIVAITFTEKAAAELRDRVRSGLDEALAAIEGGGAGVAGPGEKAGRGWKTSATWGDEPATGVEGPAPRGVEPASEGAEREGMAAREGPEAAARLREALRSLDRAPISTIHAFCQTVIRQFAPELGIDPAFDLQDEVLADRRFDEMWRLRLDALGTNDAAKAAVNRCLNLGMITADIGRLASSLWGQPELAPLLQASPLTAPEVEWPDLGAMVADLRKAADSCSDPADVLARKIAALASSIEDLSRVSQRDIEVRLASMAGLLGRSLWGGQQKNWGGGAAGVEAARAIAQAAADTLLATLLGVRSQALAAVLPYVVDFVVDDMRARGREGKLVFDDLILQTRDLLRSKPRALRALRARYDCMLIDEFQDTDPMQVEIAMAFATDPETGRLEPGRLFLVGDPKQSIYRFRRADMASYSRTREEIEGAGGRLPALVQNRRSVEVLIEWVNEVFGGLIGDGSAPEFQPPYRRIERWRETRLRGPAVGWFGGPSDLKARDLRGVEAADIARLARAAVEGDWQVEDRDTGVVRPARFGDIAVLLPTRAVLLSLERALQDAGIPYRVEGGSLVYGTQEVRDIINCLKAIHDPADEVAIVAALRSPAYACSDVEIVAFKLDGGRFDYLRPDLDSRQGRVADALRDIRERYRGRHAGSLAAFVERFLSERRLPELGILDQGTRNSFRRARFIVEQARAFESAGPESLRAFVSWLERRAGKAVLDNEGAGLDDDEDSVRVLTVHAAKGLEFPIVFVAGLGVTVSPDRRVFGMDRRTGEIAVQLGAKNRNAVFELGPVANINAQEMTHLRAERDRLLYVAATRARDHLVLSLHHRQSATDSAAARLIAAGARERAEELVPSASSAARRMDALETLSVEEFDAPEVFDERRAGLVTRARKTRFESATALIAAERSDETEPWARGRGGTHVGRAVHATLQSIAWDAGDEQVAAVSDAEAVAEAIPERGEEVARLVRRALATEAAERARAASRALREVPFALMLGRTLVEGFIDVVIDGPDGLEIVDWKTDDVSEAAVEARLEQYQLQAGLYALGLEAATGRRVSRITYAFVRAGLERSPGEAAVLAAAAREYVEARERSR